MASNIKLPRYPVLIVEDKKENQVLLNSICKEMGVKTAIAENGKIALDLVEKEKFSVFIVDLMLPVMDGKTFVEKLKVIDPNAIVIIQSALDASETIIEVMRLGVLDYTVKPIEIDNFKHILQKALEFKYLKDIEQEMILNEGIKLRGQLEWLNYKESLRLSGGDSYQKNSILNLSTSLSQGGGIGVTISLVDMLKMTAEDQGDGKCLVDKEVLDTLVLNNEHSRKVIDGLNSIINLMEEKFNFQEITARQLVEKLPEYLKDVTTHLIKKNIEFAFPKVNTNSKINVDINKLVLVLEELFINAYKYSVTGSRIQVFTHVTGTYFCITFKNEIDPAYGGVPQDKEKLVLEPFYRIHPPVEDIVEIEKFGLGLGLTVVDFVINKHSGMFFIHNAVDHTSKNISECVLAEVFLPIILERK